MITLLLDVFLQLDWLTIVGYALVALEAFIVLTRFLQIVVNPNSAFGKFLPKLLKGFVFLKTYTIDKSKQLDDDQKKRKVSK